MTAPGPRCDATGALGRPPGGSGGRLGIPDKCGGTGAGLGNTDATAATDPRGVTGLGWVIGIALGRGGGDLALLGLAFGAGGGGAGLLIPLLDAPPTVYDPQKTTSGSCCLRGGLGFGTEDGEDLNFASRMATSFGIGAGGLGGDKFL